MSSRASASALMSVPMRDTVTICSGPAQLIFSPEELSRGVHPFTSAFDLAVAHHEPHDPADRERECEEPQDPADDQRDDHPTELVAEVFSEEEVSTVVGFAQQVQRSVAGPGGDQQDPIAVVDRHVRAWGLNFYRFVTLVLRVAPDRGGPVEIDRVLRVCLDVEVVRGAGFKHHLLITRRDRPTDTHARPDEDEDYADDSARDPGDQHRQRAFPTAGRGCGLRLRPTGDRTVRFGMWLRAGLIRRVVSFGRRVSRGHGTPSTDDELRPPSIA